MHPSILNQHASLERIQMHAPSWNATLRPHPRALWQVPENQVDACISTRNQQQAGTTSLIQQARTHGAECGPTVWHPAQAAQAQPSKRPTTMLSLIQELGATCSDKQVTAMSPYHPPQLGRWVCHRFFGSMQGFLRAIHKIPKPS